MYRKGQKRVAVLDPAGLGPGEGVQSIITWAPGLANPAPPVYSNWLDIEKIVADLQGACILQVDQTGVGGFLPVPATANLEGFGRLVIVGVGALGEAQLQVADGGQIRNVQAWRTVVVRATPTIRPAVLYTIDGLVVEGFDATFQYGSLNAGALAVVQINSPSYLSMLLVGSSQFRNNHNPGVATVRLGGAITFLLGIGSNFFSLPTGFDDTISGPVGSSLTLMLDASIAIPSLPAFLGAITTSVIDTGPRASLPIGGAVIGPGATVPVGVPVPGSTASAPYRVPVVTPIGPITPLPSGIVIAYASSGPGDVVTVGITNVTGAPIAIPGGTTLTVQMVT
jgi:hypothetical protein